MTALALIDNYCERLDAAFWSEPANAITNAAFFIAAWLLYQQYQKFSSPLRVEEKDTASLILISLIALIGIGSLAFHTLANHASMLADVIPIAMFVFLYLWVALRRLLGVARIVVCLWLLAMLLAALLAGMVPNAYRFNGSIAYLPCLAALIAIGTVLSYRRHPAAKNLYIASIIFVISLTFRSIDMSVCKNFALGTHFLWHICNGVVLYILTKAILLHTAHCPK